TGLLRSALNVLTPFVVEHDVERGAVRDERRLHVLHVIARDAARVAGHIADCAAGSRASRDSDGTAEQSDDSADDRTRACIALALVADLDLALQVLRNDRVRLDALAG